MALAVCQIWLFRRCLCTKLVKSIPIKRESRCKRMDYRGKVPLPRFPLLCLQLPLTPLPFAQHPSTRLWPHFYAQPLLGSHIRCFYVDRNILHTWNILLPPSVILCLERFAHGMNSDWFHYRKCHVYEVLVISFIHLQVHSAVYSTAENLMGAFQD